MKCYLGKFCAGDKYTYHGPLSIDGAVTVVEWEPERWASEGCVGNFNFRRGLVPVFSARYPETRFWWVAPCRLHTCPDCGPAEDGEGD